MTNLLKETLRVLEQNGKAPHDVRWVGRVGPYTDPPHPFGSWGDFSKFADFEYDAGYGGAEIESDLKIVGDDWWLERGEYDGSEW